MAGFGPTLTPYEYTYVLTDVERAQLAEVQPFPFFDVKDHEYRHRFGAFRNGEIYADPRARMVVGYGLPPYARPDLVPVDPIYSPNDPRSQPQPDQPWLLAGSTPDHAPLTTDPFTLSLNAIIPYGDGDFQILIFDENTNYLAFDYSSINTDGEGRSTITVNVAVAEIALTVLEPGDGYIYLTRPGSTQDISSWLAWTWDPAGP